ncbi:MAG: leucine-rich repeat domain-containing protein [Patiriisocius sp.]|uniref:leucine-rich repeat domain-containing protein n=1 Tax=Patiriisocius sp. TaxID=2822396 RepID=UPI003EFA6F9D
MKKLLFVTALLLTASASFAQVSQEEKAALTDLFLSTNGENWIHTWNLNEPVKTWHGVTVEDNAVVGLSLLFNNLEGTIPNTLGNLEQLKKLELSFNKLSGTIPATIGDLEDLKVFAVNGNELVGTIPTTFGNLENLEQLHLSSNNLEGTIPVAIGNLENLQVLNVFDNNLGGTIPYALIDSKSLRKLVISENEITNTEAFASVILFEQGVDNPAFKNPGTFIPAKTVIATETSDDEN